MNASTRLAALPEFPTATRNSPRSFFSRQAARKAARSVVRIFSRTPILFRSFSAASATVKKGGVGTHSPPSAPPGAAGRRRRLHREGHDPRNDPPCRRAVAETRHLVDGLPIERVVDGQ